MKQKYTITVADMELSIISDAAPDEVENIVGMLDRRMRDINLKSPRCTKNEAALLCALDYCADKLKAQRKVKRLEALSAEYEIRIAELEEELEELKKTPG